MKKFQMKTSLIFVFILLLVIPITAAELIGDTLKITVYNTNNITNSTDSSMTFKVYFNSSEYKGNNKGFTFTIDTSTLKTGAKVLDSGDFNFVVFSNTTATNIDYFVLWNRTDGQLTQCKIQRGQFESQWNSCLSKLGNYEGVNATQCKDDLNVCNLLVKERDLELSTNQEKITDLQDEKEGTKNSLWLYGIVGLVVGAGGLYLWNKNKGGGSPKDKSADEWSKGQAG